VVTSSARITQQLLEAIDRLDDEREPIAEIARRVRDEADRLGLTRPGYERLRQLVHASRLARAERAGPSALRIFLEDSAAQHLTRASFDEMVKPRDERRRRRW